MSLHRSLPRSMFVGSNNDWRSSHSTRSDVKFPLKVLNVKPERKILLREVAPQEFTKQGTQAWFFENISEAISVTFFGRFLFRWIVVGI